MNASQFIRKWNRIELKERSAAQQHFLDLCDLLDHPKPADVDPTGESFTFEKGAEKSDGGDGWADVWKKNHFGWEYKGRHKDLDAAYRQLLQYRESLENPPLLVVCDMDRIIVRTNFTNTPTKKYDIPLAEIGEPGNLEILRAVFHEPDKLKPGVVREVITTRAAQQIGEIAQALRDRGLDAHAVARFLDRIVFCLFAEDVRLLPEKMFTKIVQAAQNDPERFNRFLKQLFEAMAHGGWFGTDSIRWFNGNLFNDAEVLDLTGEEIDRIRRAALLDWSAVDPSIFGTLFERGLDPSKRSQLGAHYTSREDIETLVEPVVMQPLRREWDQVRAQADSLLQSGKKKAGQQVDKLLHDFITRLGQVKVLDPACGSGNFLYVTLQKLKDLEKEVNDYALNIGFSAFTPEVGPWQLYGIEVNPYAYDLAQMTVWIGYLQWMNDHGYLVTDNPILRSMDNFKCMDAIMDLSDPDNPREPEWPEVDYIVGNPPFLGYSRLRTALGNEYVETLFRFYTGRVSNQSDLCCYWFERARTAILSGKCLRAGLLATQAIRGGKNREVINAIKSTGDVFFAQSDRPWILDGANVHVSMVAFDNGAEQCKELDGVRVSTINSNLSTASDITRAVRLVSNGSVGYVGGFKFGSFDIDDTTARQLLNEPSPHGLPNSDVVRPWINGLDILSRSRSMWIIDFGVTRTMEQSALFEAPFAILLRDVKPERDLMRRERRKNIWWLHGETAINLRAAISGLEKFIVTPRVAKHRIFSWVSPETLIDGQLIAFARSDDYFFGVLHSRLHEVWALKLGTRLETRPRYTPTTCFETFPFPKPTPEQEASIAEAARELNELRENWLNPPEWVREEILEFPGSVDGPWARYIHDPDNRGIGTVRYPRLVPRGSTFALSLAKRTLTNLYNQRPTWLALAHKKLDEAVFAAYAWNPAMTDEEILEKLLELNLKRAAEEG